MSKEKTNSLLNCPFCGGEAKIDKTIANTVSVECTVCHASSRMILCTEGDIEQKAIEAWNNRKPIDIIEERLEEEYKTYNSNSYEDDFIAQGVMIAIEIVSEEGGMND